MVVCIQRQQINTDVLQECVVNCSCPQTPLTDGVGHKVCSTFHKSLMSLTLTHLVNRSTVDQWSIVSSHTSDIAICKHSCTSLVSLLSSNVDVVSFSGFLSLKLSWSIPII